MSAGFYKRRRGVLEHLESGKISLLDLAIHDYLNLKANLVVGGPCTVPPGICISSAAAIHATCPSQISERAVQRSLERLEKIGWIRRWNVRGKRGNYPVLVCRSSVHDLSGNEYRVNGEDTTDWRSPALVPVGELSSLPSKADAKLSGDREVRSKNREKKAAAPDSRNFWKLLGTDLPMGTPRFQKIAEHYFTTRNGSPLSEAMERIIQRANKEGVKVPPKFFEAKREVERNETEVQANPKAEPIRELEVPVWAN